MSETIHSDPGFSEIIASHRLVQDLFVPNAWGFWRELIVTGSLSWGAILTVIVSDSPWIMATAGVFAAIFWYRGVAMIHELTHQHSEQLSGFNLVWNLVFGLP